MTFVEEPVVGSGPEHAATVSAGMARAREMRDLWLRSLAAGSASFAQVVDMSRTDEYKALSSLRLLHILEARPGWNEYTATQAMIHQGFDVKANIQSIRKSPRSVQRFSNLMQVDSERWRPRPEFPSGWPFMGKLEALFSDNPETLQMPDELSALLEDQTGTDERPDTAASDDEVLASLIGISIDQED